MSELLFRKMICNSGHESQPYPMNGIAPRMCPVCRMRYDRKYNRPIPCLEDGTVPEEKTEEPVTEPVTEAPAEERSYTENPYTANSYEDTPSTETPYTETALGNGRRGRRGDAMPAMPQNISPAASRRGRRGPEPEESGNPAAPAYVGGTERTPVYAGSTERTPVYAGSTERTPVYAGGTERASVYTGGAVRPALFTGGECIRIPEGGCTLGREAYGAEYFAMNHLISRNHAYVETDRLGNVRVRDEGSLNGTYVDDGNGKRKIKPFETVELKAGNTIWLANQILAIEER